MRICQKAHGICSEISMRGLICLWTVANYAKKKSFLYMLRQVLHAQCTDQRKNFCTSVSYLRYSAVYAKETTASPKPIHVSNHHRSAQSHMLSLNNTFSSSFGVSPFKVYPPAKLLVDTNIKIKYNVTCYILLFQSFIKLWLLSVLTGSHR